MFKGFGRLWAWCRESLNFRRSRRPSDYRKVSITEKLIYSGALQRGRLTGSPLARECK